MKRSKIHSAIILIILFLSVTGYGQAPFVPHLSLQGHWNKHKGPEPYNSLWGWTGANGREYAILGSVDSIYFFDITIPTHPKLCDARAGRSNNCINREFKTYKHYCYAIGDQGHSSLQIYDLQYLPDSVHKVYDEDSLCENAHNLFFDHDRVYLAYNKHVNKKTGAVVQNALRIASVKNPEIPVYIADLIPGYKYIQGVKDYDFVYVHDLFVRNDTAYCSVGENGLYIYNFKNPTSPVLLSFYNAAGTGEYNHSCWLNPDGNVLINTVETGRQPITAFDVSGLKDTASSFITMETLSTFGSHENLGSTAHNSFIKNKLVYVSYYQDGVVIFEMSDSTNIKEIASYNTYTQNTNINYSGLHGCWNVYPFFPSGSIIASDMSNGLFIFKLDSVSAINSGYLCFDHMQVKVLQNPFQNKIRLKVTSDCAEKAHISLTNMLGQSLYQSDVQILNEATLINIPYIGSDQIILLTITTKNGSYSQKLVCGN